MPQHLQFVVIAAIVGSGVMSGLLFAFSLVVMRALLELPAGAGMSAMQRINVLIVNPLFLVLFLGTTFLCVVVAFLGWRALPSDGALWLLCGAATYLLGPFGVTIVFNVPLNNRLAATPATEAAVAWPLFVASWLRWNHVRAALGVVATALLAVGLARAARGI